MLKYKYSSKNKEKEEYALFHITEKKPIGCEVLCWKMQKVALELFP